MVQSAASRLLVVEGGLVTVIGDDVGDQLRRLCLARIGADDVVSIGRLGPALTHTIDAEGLALYNLSLVPDALCAWPGGESRPLDALRGARVLAVSAIGDPLAFRRELEALGASVQEAAFGDHHAFTARDAVMLARRGEGCDLVVCTLKDAVKLGPLWPRVAPACRYLSQGVRVEHGREAVDHLLDAALDARATIPQHIAG